jgi:hypothetical protein
MAYKKSTSRHGARRIPDDLWHQFVEQAAREKRVINGQILLALTHDLRTACAQEVPQASPTSAPAETSPAPAA